MHVKDSMATQGELKQKLERDYRATQGRIASLARPLDPERLLRRPGPDRWSVGEVLEHLTLMDGLFLRAVEPLVRTARRDAGAAARPWAPSRIGKGIAESQRNPKPLKAAKAARPATPRAGVFEAFLAGHMRFAQLLAESNGLDWNDVRLRPPVMPWFPLKMNLGDVFQIHGVHVQRHCGQIERTIADLS
jgi:hypothetical protein